MNWIKHKVEVQGIFNSGITPINQACYVNTPQSTVLSTKLDDPYCLSPKIMMFLILNTVQCML